MGGNGRAVFYGDNVLVASCDSTLYCLGSAGQKVWEAKTEGPIHGSPALTGDAALVAGCGSVLQVFDARTGAELGRMSLAGEVAGTAAVIGNIAYVGIVGRQVVALDWMKLTCEWAFDAPRRQHEFYSSAVVTDDLVIAGSRDRNVYGLARKTGKRVWHFTTKGEVDGIPGLLGD